jgi:RNA polymerase sigma-70 factor (ECF subfamily)
MQSDEELMKAYVEGDETAFAELFARYGALLLRVMRRQIINEDDASELVQQTFLQMHRARRDFEPGRKLRPWLMTIAFNLKREYFRRRMRRPEAQLDHDPPASDRGDPVDRASEAQRLRRALARLPEGQRDVIAMHWFEELSFNEVAEVMGLTVSAVKVRAHRGYQTLRRALEEVTSEEDEK